MSIRKIRPPGKGTKGPSLIRPATKATADWVSVLEALGDAVLIIDPGTGIVRHANRKASELFGRTVDGTVGQTWAELCGAEDADEADREISETTGAGSVFERLIRRKNGDSPWVEVSLGLATTVNGRFVIATVRDVTYKKEIERELTATKDYLNTVFNNIHDAVFVHDIDGKVLDVNEKMLEMYQFTREEAIGLSIMADYTTSEDRPDLPAVWRRVINGENAFMECRGRRSRDGFEFDVEVFLNRLRLPDGDSILATIRDISERKKWSGNCWRRRTTSIPSSTAYTTRSSFMT